VDEREAEADGERGEVFGGALVGGTEDDRQEAGGEGDLDEDAGEQRAVVSVAVGGEAAGEGEALLAAADEVGTRLRRRWLRRPGLRMKRRALLRIRGA
jgi:hypothetical protein